METIGLIGGMSFESSAVYYRLVNEMVRDRKGGLASAELILHSVNFEEIVALQKAGAWDMAARRLADVALRLQIAGAGCILICTNTMLVSADANTRAGKFDIVTEDFTKLTGKQPQPLKDFFVEHKAALTA